MTGDFQDTTKQTLARFEAIVSHKALIAERIRIHADSFAGNARRRLIELSRFFEQALTPIDLLRLTEATSVSGCILAAAAKSRCADEEAKSSLSTHAIDDGIRDACSKFMKLGLADHAVKLLLLYPLALLFCCSLLLLFYSHFVIPEFERMFDEFGLRLPASTRATLYIASIARQFGIWIAATVLFAFACRAYVSHYRNRYPKTSSLWLASNWFESARESWARWAWHVATLLESGVERRDAIQLATESSREPSIQNSCNEWLKVLRRDANPFANSLVIPGNIVAPVDYALGMKSGSDQAALLRDVALSFSELERSRRSWWMTWFSPLTVCILGLSAWMMYASLFSPLISLISGLT